MNALVKYRNIKTIRNYNSNYKTLIKDAPGIQKYDNWSYNCFGYALGYYDWLDLHSFEWLEDEECATAEKLLDMFEDCCDELEERYQLTRVYDANIKLPSNQHLIAFRVGYDDFHFARRNSDGTWSHKPGRSYIRPMSEEELFGAQWCPDRYCPYVSHNAYFIVKKGNKWYE